MKKRSLALGILLGITVVVSLGVVFIDNINHYWRVGGAGGEYVQLLVSNRLVMTVNTNTGRIGINETNANSDGVIIRGSLVFPTNATGNGVSAAVVGRVNIVGGAGGSTFATNDAAGGAGGAVQVSGGAAGNAPFSVTNTTGGNGGAITLAGGSGNPASTSVATNSVTAGNGGAFTMTGGGGGSPSPPATNTIGGNGGAFTMTGGVGGTPSGGVFRKGGLGGSFTLTGGNGGNATRTNGGDGGFMTLNAGSAGSAATSGNPGTPGYIQLVGGNGNTGDSNSFGGGIYLLGGDGGATAPDGDVVVGRAVNGTTRGGLQVGPLVAGTTATMTNLLSVTAVLDFPSIAAGVVADLPVAFAGAADGDVVTLGVPLSSVTNCIWMGFASNAVVYVRAANGQLVTAQDPNSGTFRIVLQKFR